jgi:hypothetical protein
MDKMFASARFRSEPLIVLLLLSMFALSLRVQLAKFDNFHTFAGTHILHGDLRPDGDAAGQIFANVPRVAAAALAAILFRLIAAPSSLISGSVSPLTHLHVFCNAAESQLVFRNASRRHRVK